MTDYKERIEATAADMPNIGTVVYGCERFRAAERAYDTPTRQELEGLTHAPREPLVGRPGQVLLGYDAVGVHLGVKDVTGNPGVVTLDATNAERVAVELLAYVAWRKRLADE